MNCTPENCPHRALMDKARKACLLCDNTPAGHGGVASFDAMGERVLHREKICFDRSPRGQVTTLPADVEERTAELYRRWCGLGTIDALLLLHVSNGGTTANFGAYLDRVRRAIDDADVMRDAYRATAWAKYKALMRRFAPFLKGKLHAWDEGHGGAIRKEREDFEAAALQGDLFEWGKGCGNGPG